MITTTSAYESALPSISTMSDAGRHHSRRPDRSDPRLDIELAPFLKVTAAGGRVAPPSHQSAFGVALASADEQRGLGRSESSAVLARREKTMLSASPLIAVDAAFVNRRGSRSSVGDGYLGMVRREEDAPG